MNHERQMPKVKLILMSSKQQMTHEELLEEVQSIYSTDTPEFWNEITDDELWQMKNEAEREEIIGADFEEFDFGITVLRSKEQLLASIDNAKMRYQMEAQQEQPPHTQAFYRNVEHLLSKFHGKVETTIFPQKLDHWWYYAYIMNTSGITLYLCHAKWEATEYGYNCHSEFCFELIKISAKTMSCAEYAVAYDVKPSTVRQWIRRGRIRDAIKAGNEWRIPELSEIQHQRGYKNGWFYWDDQLKNVPLNYEIPANCSAAFFMQQKDNKKLFDIFFTTQDKIQKADCVDWGSDSLDGDSYWLQDAYKLTLSMDEREKFEVYMIANPLVNGQSEYIDDFDTDYGHISVHVN